MDSLEDDIIALARRVTESVKKPWRWTVAIEDDILIFRGEDGAVEMVASKQSYRDLLRSAGREIPEWLGEGAAHSEQDFGYGVSRVAADLVELCRRSTVKRWARLPLTWFRMWRCFRRDPGPVASWRLAWATARRSS